MKKLLQGVKILVIAENQVTAQVISKDLIKSGAVVSTYTNGLEGLAALRTITPDIAFVDTLTPLMNGREILEVMNMEGLIKDTPAIVLASSSETEVIQSLVSLGASDYLLKDKYEPGEIVDKVETYLNIKSTKVEKNEHEIDIGSMQPDNSEVNGTINVLIVEDDPLLRNLLSVKLTRSGIRYNFSHDGLNAIPLIRKHNPDVLILDLMLPGKDGFTILTELKEDDELSKIPVIILSNRSSSEEFKQAKELGAEKFYVKALTDLNEVVSSIKELA